MKLRIAMHGERSITKNTRGRPFCGLAAFVGTGPTMRAHVYTAANLDEITIDSHKKMDGARLAKQFEVDMCMVNGGRYWLMDDQDVQGGDVVNFDGVNLLYGGEMTGAEMTAQMQTPYAPNLIYRNTNWIWHAGTPVHLLREPNGTVWVMQEYTKDVDAEPDARQPAPGGQQAEGPAQGLGLRDQGAHEGAVAQHGAVRRLGGHPPRRAALHLPGLWLRHGHECELHPVTRNRGCKGRSAGGRDPAFVRAEVGRARRSATE